MNAIVAKQVEAGVDIGNNGEQQRDSFIFYIRDRLTGLGGSWQRKPARRRRALSDLQEGILRGLAAPGIGRRHPRPAEGDRRDRLSGCQRREGRMRGLPRHAGRDRQSVRRAVPHRALARHGVGDREERALQDRGGVPRRARQPRCATNTRRSSTRASCCSSIARISRARSTTPSRTGRSPTSSRSAIAWSMRSTRRSTTFRPRRCGCTCAGATTKARTISTSSCR